MLKSDLKFLFQIPCFLFLVPFCHLFQDGLLDYYFLIPFIVVWGGAGPGLGGPGECLVDPHEALVHRREERPAARQERIPHL